MTDDDLPYRFRLRVFALAHELGSVRAACRAMGIHPSTYYRWKEMVDRGGLEMLRPRERRAPRMPNAVGVLVSQRIIAFSLGHPGFGPARISSELARPLWGGFQVSPAGVYRVLRRHGLHTREKRLGLVAGCACPPESLPRDPEPERHLDAPHPGSLVQMPSGGSPAPRASSGSTRRSMSPPASAGRSSIPAPGTRPPTGAPISPKRWPRISRAVAGSSRCS